MQGGDIVAFGGGGFSMEPGNRLLDDFVLSPRRRVLRLRMERTERAERPSQESAAPRP